MGEVKKAVSTDNATLDVIGITSTGAEKYIRTLKSTDNTMDISDIDAVQYPYVQLKMRNADSVNYTPYQLRYWHVLFTPVPEGALAGNVKLINKDTIDLGQDFNFAIAFKNISDQPFTDSIKATVNIKDRSNALYTIPISKLKRIEPGDTAMVDFTIPGDTSIYNAKVPASQRMPIGTINLGDKIL